VTHCYQRPRHEGVWPYNFFAMTHGRSEAESKRRVQQVRDVMEDHWDVGDDDWDTLFSTEILKKTGIRMDERDPLLLTRCWLLLARPSACRAL
jgi:hypothetical protein